MGKRAVQIWLVAFLLLVGASASAQEKQEQPEQTQRQSIATIRPKVDQACIICPPRTTKLLFKWQSAGNIWNVGQPRSFASETFAAQYPQKSDRFFDGWLGRVEGVVRTKRLIRFETTSFWVDVGSERRYRHGIWQPHNPALPTSAPGSRLGIWPKFREHGP